MSSTQKNGVLAVYINPLIKLFFYILVMLVFLIPHSYIVRIFLSTILPGILVVWAILIFSLPVSAIILKNLKKIEVFLLPLYIYLYSYQYGVGL